MTSSSTSPLHILKPINLNVTFYKCLISDDPRLPLQKVSAELPSICVDITDAKLLLLVSLITSIPFSEEVAPPAKPLVSNIGHPIQSCCDNLEKNR